MRAEAIVDLSAIKFNVELLKKTSGTKLLAVVKADAYGHGLVPVAQAAVSAGADYLGVALLEEAVALREAGITAPILAWLVQPGSDFSQAISLDIDIAAASLKALSEIAAASRQLQKKARVHLEVDTGMTRGGFLAEWDQLDSEHVKGVEIVGIFSHFARADEPGEKQNQDQMARFAEMVAKLEALGFSQLIKHLSNSAATLKITPPLSTWCVPELRYMDSHLMCRLSVAQVHLSCDLQCSYALPCIWLKMFRLELQLVTERPNQLS